MNDFVPIIDLSARDTGDGRAAVAADIGKACETSGFFIIAGHGVSDDLIDRMYRTTNAFFTLPDAQKDLSFELFFTHIVAHELAHGLGPHQIKINGRDTNPRMELKDLYSAVEEAKAEFSGEGLIPG